MLTMFKILHYVQEKDPFHFSYIFSAFFDRHLPQLSFNTITLLNCVFTIGYLVKHNNAKLQISATVFLSLSDTIKS